MGIIKKLSRLCNISPSYETLAHMIHLRERILSVIISARTDIAERQTDPSFSAR